MRTHGITLLAAACFIALTAIPAEAQYFGRNKVQYDRFDFKVLRTENFQIHFYPEEEQAVRDVARMSERWYHRHSQVFQHVFREQKPLIFYANDADFHQTNVISGTLGEGTGGVTEALKERVVMPLTPLYEETHHVLGHELVHSFQYDIALNRTDTIRFNLGRLPLWLVEGMAEYLSVGRDDAHTAMWLRDSAMRDDLPSIDQLTRDMRYFPYRFGQAYSAYIGGKYGDVAVTNIYKLAGQAGVDQAILAVTGITADSLSNEWREAVKSAYLPLMEGRTEPGDAGRRVLADDIDAGEINIAPALSPDGRYVAFLSERDIFHFNLFVANAQTGEVVKRLEATASDPHFDAIRFINSAGTWSPDGTQFAFITFVGGDNEIAIWDLDSGSIERRIKVQGVNAMLNPAWSPDGRSIAFSGVDGGISDLYVYNLETRAVRQLTNDRFADMQPAWSPDGRTLAFVTDRGPDGSNFETLEFAPVRLGLINVQSGSIDVIRPFRNSTHYNPQFSPDGQSLYFISDQDGFKDIYRYSLAGGEPYRVTNLKTGVSGISALSPAMTVASQSGDMMFSVFADNKYTVFARTTEQTAGLRIEEAEGIASARLLPPQRPPSEGLIGSYLADAGSGLPPEVTEPPRDYRAKLTLDYVAPPTFGVAAGGAMGTQLAGGIGFFFSDMLGNQNLSVAVQAQGTFKDIGAQVSYLNQGGRLNYGAVASHIPLLFGQARAGFITDPETGGTAQVVERVFQRIFIDQAFGVVTYPLTTTRRFEFNAGVTRYGFDFEVERNIILPNGQLIRERESLDEAEPDAVFLAQAVGAYVGDYSVFGFTSPVQGGRYRFHVAPQVGSASFVTLLADYRRYLFMNPVTFAVRGLHIGNYGASENELFSQEYLGHSYYPGFVRGYSFGSFNLDECSSDNGDCPEISRLQGTRIALTSAELRLPFFGTERFGLINFPWLPTELVLFADAGLAWTGDESPVLSFERRSSERVPVVSTGVSARMNLFGYMIMEVYYAVPFQRPDRGPHLGIQLVPGW